MKDRNAAVSNREMMREVDAHNESDTQRSFAQPKARSSRLTTLMRLTATSAALVGVLALTARAQEMGPGGEVITGSGEYRMHCAQCHGMDGKGDGPVAPALKVKPADLTMLAKNNGGVFPEKKLVDAINGTSAVAAHGYSSSGTTTPMPIWGLAFRASTHSGTGASFTPQEVNRKIKILVNYIKSIQQK